jgi:hypothetical protein
MFGDYTAAEEMLRRYLRIEARVRRLPTMSRAVAAAELFGENQAVGISAIRAKAILGGPAPPITFSEIVSCKSK